MTRFALQRMATTLTAVAVVIVAGVQAYIEMPRAEDPGFTIRIAQVLTIWPGASPERVENLVTDPLEEVIQEMPELDYISSTSKTGVSVINVNIRANYMDLQPIWDKLRRKVEKVRDDLPESIIGPTVNDEFGDVFGMLFSITGPDYTYQDLKRVADRVRDELLVIEDVAKVDIAGAQEERVFVEYNNARLAELGLTPVRLRQILEAQNIVIPGGDLLVGEERLALEPTGNFESVDDLRRTVISIPGEPNLLYLEDIAEVTRDYVDPPSRVVHYMGERALVLAISMRDGGNILELGDQVRTLMHDQQGAYPWGISFNEIQFQTDPVRQKVNGFIANLLQAVGLVALVMLVFLGLRTGLIVAALVPMAIISCFMVMGFFGIGLNQISLAALIIALGMLVDNGIVMAESIMVLMEQGKKGFDAAIQAAKELRIALLTSSLTTAAAFLPIYLAENESGEYTAALFQVVTITLLCSWVIALTVIPLLAVQFLKVKKSENSYDSRFYRGYRGLLLTALRLRYGTLLLVAILFFAAIQGMKLVPNIFFPPNERATFTLEMRLPIGTAIEETESVVSQVEQILTDRFVAGAYAGAYAGGDRGITNWGAFVGSGAPRFILTYNQEPPSPEYAVFIVNTTDREVIDPLVADIERELLETFPEVQPTVRPLELGPPVGKPIGFRISGRDFDTLFNIVEDVKALLRETQGAKQVDDNWGAQSKKLIVDIDQPRARRAGVTSQDIAISLQTYLSGFTTTEYREGDKLIPVVMRATGADRQDLGKLDSINVYAQSTGQSVPLRQVADVDVRWQPAKIIRRDTLRTVTVEADLARGFTAKGVNDQAMPKLADMAADWPRGYSFELGGEEEQSEKSQGAIAEKLPVAALIIVLLLVTQFNSIRKPLIILCTIPLGLIGVVIGLIVVPEMYFGFMTLLGLISLAGIVINNAIVLLDRIDIEITENGRAPNQAIVAAAQQRLRPILLTTMTTVAGMVPLYLGGGPMFEPMAIAIIFGLLFATVLTLVVVPVLYALFYRVSFKGFTYAREA
jgi:multidrug efflux pump subunit AcrB